MRNSFARRILGCLLLLGSAVPGVAAASPAPSTSYGFAVLTAGAAGFTLLTWLRGTAGHAHGAMLTGTAVMSLAMTAYLHFWRLLRI